MIYQDRVYGEINITEPVALELLNSSTLQRLQGIDQAGYFEPYFPGTAFKRFEHSVGVYWLLKKYQAPLAEQIAGLIHDVSHAAFSHCIDYVLEVGSQTEHSHQDNVFAKYVWDSEIPEILARFGLNVDFILDDHNFPLKEKLLPDLCADRLDYSLRTAIIFKDITFAEGQEFLNDLVVVDNFWAFKTPEIGQKYAELFAKLNTQYYAGLESAVMFRSLGDYLRRALRWGYINEADLYLTDQEVLDKIKPFRSEDRELAYLWTRVMNQTGFKNDPLDYEAEVFCKSRVVDPWCVVGSDLKKISEINPSWAEVVKMESQPKKYFVKFLK